MATMVTFNLTRKILLAAKCCQTTNVILNLPCLSPRKSKASCCQRNLSSEDKEHQFPREKQQHSYFFHEGFQDVWRDKFENSFLIFDNFVTEEEEDSLLKEVEPHLQRQVYEKDHWDDAISGFRETERKHWNASNEATLRRLRERAFRPQEELLPHVHVLDLAPGGLIKPHVDSARFCGATVAVLSLMSDCVARFVLEKDKSQRVDCLLPRRSLYIMRDSSRYDFTHEILGTEDSKVEETFVPKGRRISIVCRCAPS